jgi:hypothetical protein
MKYSRIISFFLFLSLSFATLCQVTAQIEPKPEIKTVEFNKDMFYHILPDTVAESSGLIFWDGLLWTHNDGNNQAAIYGIDTATGNIRKTIHLKGVKNYDWEDITQDAGYIYVGDFGNNSGAFREMFIYKIHKGSITDDKADVFVNAEEIAFEYADHDRLKKQMHEHNFDCEALFEFDKQLYIFTKNWADHKTRMYSMPAKPDMYHVSPITTFDVGGLITGADISRSGERMALVGYVDFIPFVCLFWDFKDNDFFGGKNIRVDLPELAFVQTEGITFTTEDELFISCEASAEPQSLFKVKFNDLVNAGKGSGELAPKQLIVPGKVSQPSKKELSVQFTLDADADVLVELYNSRWKMIDEKTYKKGSSGSPAVTFNAKGLRDGNYFLKYILQNDADVEADMNSHENAVIQKIEIGR